MTLLQRLVSAPPTLLWVDGFLSFFSLPAKRVVLFCPRGIAFAPVYTRCRPLPPTSLLNRHRGVIIIIITDSRGNCVPFASPRSDKGLGTILYITLVMSWGIEMINRVSLVMLLIKCSKTKGGTAELVQCSITLYILLMYDVVATCKITVGSVSSLTVTGKGRREQWCVKL